MLVPGGAGFGGSTAVTPLGQLVMHEISEPQHPIIEPVLDSAASQVDDSVPA